MKERIAVVGGGLMGLGIACVFCRNGHPVSLYEPLAEQRRTLVARLESLLEDDGLDPGLAKHLRVAAHWEELGTDLAIVFEAGPEKLPVKQGIFRELVEHTSMNTILASNTSVIPITAIAAGVAPQYRPRIIGTHWWNPANLIPLVEVVRTEHADTGMLEAACSLLARAGKRPVLVEKDVTGFIGNRLQHALWREAQALISAGVCTPETIDIVVKNSFGMRLAVLGPIENADLVGLDLTLDIHQVVLKELSQASAPLPALVERVEKGELGAKTGQGFLAWDDARRRQLQRRLNLHLRRMLESRKGQSS